MVCNNCKKAADTGKKSLHCGKPGQVTPGCFCQHWGTKKIYTRPRGVVTLELPDQESDG